MLTLFGKFCRKLRIDGGELLKDMSDKLGVTSSYLSAVENGKRNIPQDWYEKLSRLYALDVSQKRELAEAIQESQLSVRFELNGMGREDKNLIMALARELKDLDEDNKIKIQQILLNHKKGGGQ